ncbi:hypothetical protein [Longitalea arenae]|uniref:hypothetical protein n=1 Tax=Longitalea arenae TaxID=2812558 RepID=UPI001967960E|nr:hypothetical protein [Longitalea arenae]
METVFPQNRRLSGEHSFRDGGIGAKGRNYNMVAGLYQANTCFYWWRSGISRISFPVIQ